MGLRLTITPLSTQRVALPDAIGELNGCAKRGSGSKRGRVLPEPPVLQRFNNRAVTPPSAAALATAAIL